MIGERLIPICSYSAAFGRLTGITDNIYASEIARGLDIFELTPSKYLTQNEIDAAKSVQCK